MKALNLNLPLIAIATGCASVFAVELAPVAAIPLGTVCLAALIALCSEG